MISNKTIQARLFKSFEAHTGNIAVECEGHAVTYAVLDRESNHIANWLVAQGIKKETFIAVMVDDKIALVTVILGIVKAGCVFVPLDSNYPDKRTEAMLLASETSYVFASEERLEKLKAIRRSLPHQLDILTINETFYLPQQAIQITRHENRYKLSEAEKTRYQRQILMDGWGIEGQERLKAATVFVAGAGGSGSPLIQQLALCGFGTIIICDYDSIELSNLNRQSLHDESRIGMNKALSAKMTVERLNPNINVIPRQEKITRENVFELVGDAEIIFDNVDSLEAKTYLSECAVAKGIPHIISSMIHINAYACIFHTPHTPCFHCLYDRGKIEDIVKAKTLTRHYEVIPNSVASPALHLSTGFVVNEAVKILLGMGKPAYNKYIHFNQYGSPGVIHTNGYKQITYPFNDHFRKISREQGFDWDTCWHGQYVEEIQLTPNPKCPVCSNSSQKVFAGVQGAVFSKSAPWPPEASRDIDYQPEDKINIYFTSGTTGQPKAVLGKNESLTHFISWEIKSFNIDETKRVSQLTSQCHDPFLRDIFVSLCSGGTICVPDSKETILNSRRLRKWLEESKVNLVHCTPGVFKIIESDGELAAEAYGHLEYVLLAGEKVVPKDLENWYRVLGDRVQLVNVYGPTETTLAKLFYLIKPEDVNRDTMPIGKPIPGARVIILDKERNVCGPGEVGEIYIRTPFRSYGYYNDPPLTCERFIKNPFSDNPDDIIYKTGDLGKINREGDVEFVGREDRQVKIRGFRVELEEIEKRIREYPGIREAVVLNRRTGTGNHILCLYFKGETAVPELKAFLSRELPDYMVPSFCIKMETFPLNVNGKINYNALPEPDEVDRKDYAAPTNELERKMVRTWSDILGIEKIGIHDGFLDMGGNSLNAMNLTSRIYKEFNVNLQLSVIFENPTVEELVSIIETSGTSIYEDITPVDGREYYPLSSAQMRMFLLREFAGGDDISYNQPKPLHLEGPLDKERLEEAFKGLIARHETLRTGFVLVNGTPMQRIHPTIPFTIESLQSSSVDHMIKNFIKPFDPAQPPLSRVGLMEIAEDEHILIFDIHHIISDGVTTEIFIDEFMKLYNREPLPVLPIQYKDYAVWQQEILQSELLKKQEAYWLKVFEEEAPVLNLTTDYPRPAVQNFEGSHWNFDVDVQLIRELEARAREWNATLYMILLAAYNTLLYRYTGQEDIVVGSPTAGRPHADLQRIPGVFINTLAMRNRPSGSKTFEQLLAEVTENAFNAYENQDYPFEELVGKLDLNRDLQRSPLFETIFIMQNIDMKPIRLEGLEIKAYPFDVPTSKFDISLNVLETPGGFLFNIEYCTRLFRQETIERFSRHFVTVLETAARDARLTLSQIDILSQEEKEQLIHRFNDTAGDYPGDKTVHELFEEQVEKTPDHIAVVGTSKNNGLITYSQLNQKVNQLAYLLGSKGVQPGAIVGIMENRSIELVIGILGILKAGGAYLPIDPAFPQERIDYMLTDSNAKVLVSEVSRIRIIGPIGPILKKLPAYPTHLCYVIYTSGSTGRPKGVAVRHRNVTNFISAMAGKIDFSASKIILALTTISFDIFVLETLLPLVRGLRVVVAGEVHQTDAHLLKQLIKGQCIDILQVTPSRLKLLLQEQDNREFLEGISELIVGGEAFPGDLYEAVKTVFTGKLYNVYGPTETTVWSTLKDLSKNSETLTIGKPILNTEIFIVDKDNNLLPVGAAGDLCICGEGTASGYINNPELTAETFNRSYRSYISYRTGDLARWLPNSEVQFLGRVDQQVKIRGFRIEPGEIERYLVNHEAIKEAVVIAREDHNNDNYLCAYIVPNTSDVFEKISALSTELKKHLSQQLPDYMIPSLFVPMETIPLTPNGKMNRQALPAPEIAAADNYAPPRNPMEEKLVDIWSDVLMIESHAAGIDTSFFDLGGHSLKATLLLSKIHETFHVRIPMPELFKKPFIKGLSEYIQQAEGMEQEVFIAIEPSEKKEYYELSFHQQRLWIIHQLEEKNLSYNMPMRIELGHAVHVDAVKKVLFKLVERHESLRTAFKEVNGTTVQFIENAVELPFEMIDISFMEPGKKERERERIFRETAETSFDFTRAPLFRAVMIQWDKERYDLVFNIHHIISDGWSMGILEREFTRLYQRYKEGAEDHEPAPPLQYKDFSGWHNRQVNEPRLRETSHRFWLEKLKGGVPLLQLPVDFTAHRRDTAGAGYRCRVPREVKERLEQLAETNRTTLSMVVFSIYNILLAHIANQSDIVCSLIGAGRDHLALREVVGYFTNSILVKTHVDPEEDFIDLLHRVHHEVIETLQHQSYPLEPVLDELKMDFPGINVSYNMLNMQDIASAAGEEQPETQPVHMEKAQGVKFDLALFVTEYQHSLELLWNYRKSLFKPGTIESIARIFLDLLRELSEDEEEF